MTKKFIILCGRYRFFSSLSFYHGLDMFLATRDALVINGSYPGFFTSSHGNHGNIDVAATFANYKKNQQNLEECSGKKRPANCHWPFVFKNCLCLGKHTSKGYNFPISFQTSSRLNDVEPVAKKTPSNSEDPRRGTLGIVVSSPNISQVPTPNSRHSHATWANRRG